MTVEPGHGTREPGTGKAPVPVVVCALSRHGDCIAPGVRRDAGIPAAYAPYPNAPPVPLFRFPVPDSRFPAS